MKLPLLSVAVGPASDSRAIYVTLSFVTGWVTVVLLLVTPVITFQLQNTDEPGGGGCVRMHPPRQIWKNKYTWKLLTLLKMNL